MLDLRGLCTVGR